jgi:hypothetical protein
MLGVNVGRLEMAENCPLPLFHEGLLWRKQTLGIRSSAAANDPLPTFIKASRNDNP